jgi:hypothetical protein
VALSLDVLKSALEQRWLVPSGGAFPSTPAESADRFAAAVSGWFASAQAGAFPCTTAALRRAQLAAGALQALQAQTAPAAGNLLAVALASYLAGQQFGAGIAAPPLATAAAGAAIGTALADVQASGAARAQRIASACTLLASSTLVTFAPPPPLPPAPVS